ESFETREQTPGFSQHLRIQAWRLARAQTEQADHAAGDLLLLAGGESRGHALPENQPLGLTLNVLWVDETGSVDLPQFGDAERVHGRSESRTHAEACQIEPARFMTRADLPAIDGLQQGVGKAANHGERP